MTSRLQHPDDSWLPRGLSIAGASALVIAVAAYFTIVHVFRLASLDEATLTQLSALKVDRRATAAVEQRWTAEGFDAGYLTAPVGPLPCRLSVDSVPLDERAAAAAAFTAVEEANGEERIERLAEIVDSRPSSLLVALMFGTTLIEAKRHAGAETVITRALDATLDDENIISAAKNRASGLDFDNDRLSTVIHLHHALGVIGLSETGSTPPWKALKNVIGSVRPLSRRVRLGASTGEDVASKQRIPAPGCARDARSLSSHDLFNNLIVGYARAKYVNPIEREREFSRDRSLPGPVLRLFFLQRDRQKAGNYSDESLLWALSNAERVLDWGTPDDARINYNIVQVLDWWVRERCGDCRSDLIAAVREVEDGLLTSAIRQHDVSDDQQEMFARGVTRMLAHSNVDRKQIEGDLQVIRGWLKTPQQAQVLADLITADNARAELPAWLTRGEPGPSPFERLGGRAAAWRNAAESDYAAAAAVWAGEQPLGIRRQVAIALRQLLGGATPPDELLTIEESFPPWQRVLMRLCASRIAAATAAAFIGLILWLLAAWIMLQIREKHSLHTSFYEIELDHLRNHGGTQSGRPRA